MSDQTEMLDVAAPLMPYNASIIHERLGKPAETFSEQSPPSKFYNCIASCDCIVTLHHSAAANPRLVGRASTVIGAGHLGKSFSVSVHLVPHGSCTAQSFETECFG